MPQEKTLKHLHMTLLSISSRSELGDTYLKMLNSLCASVDLNRLLLAGLGSPAHILYNYLLTIRRLDHLKCKQSELKSRFLKVESNISLSFFSILVFKSRVDWPFLSVFLSKSSHSKKFRVLINYFRINELWIWWMRIQFRIQVNRLPHWLPHLISLGKKTKI